MSVASERRIGVEREPFVRRIIFPIARFLPGKPEVVWTHGLKNDPEGYVFDADVVHEVNIENFERAKALPQRSASLILLPHFSPDLDHVPDRSVARDRLGVRTSKVMLCVGRVESKVKRVDHIVSEAALLPDDWTLVICGSLDEPAILQDARKALGDRVVHVEVAHDEMPLVYATADVVAHAAVEEGFGIVLLEAMRSSVGVFTHQRKLFQWILEDGGVQVDMTVRGALAEQIRRLDQGDGLERLGRIARERFASVLSWEALKYEYEALLLGTTPADRQIKGTHSRPGSRALLRSRQKIAATALNPQGQGYESA